MNLVRWKRFTWDLSKALPKAATLPPNFQIRPADKSEEKAVRDVILNALALDYGWGEMVKDHRVNLEHQLDNAFDCSPISALVVKHGQRIIAASLMSPEIDVENHLLSGPCVFSEYRNRGIGSALLQESLRFLNQNGLTLVHGLCREPSLVGKFVYRKFDSTSEMLTREPLTLERSR